MPGGPEVTSPGSPSEGTPRGNNNHDQSTSYIARLPTLSGNSIEFDWWKSKIYTHIIGLEDELWHIFEDYINFEVDGVGMVTDRKNLTPVQKKVYRKHHRVRHILVESLPHS